MPKTPEEAAKLTEEEEEWLSQLDEQLNEVIQGLFNPLNPAWSVKLPLGVVDGLGMSDPVVSQDFGMSPEEAELLEQAARGRLEYLQSLLVTRFAEAGWVLSINEDEGYLKISRKAQA